MVLCVALTLLVFGLVNAADYYVTPTGNGIMDGSSWTDADDSIQAGINFCCAAAGGTVHVGNGTYTTVNDTFPLAISGCTGVTLLGYGGTYQGPTINAGGTERVVKVLGSTGIKIENFLITGGVSAGDGGGILIIDSAVVLRALEVTGNTCAGSGGGVAWENSRGRTYRCCIWENTAASATGANSGGGGLYLYWPTGDATFYGYEVRDCCIFWNSATTFGGGIYLEGGGNGYSEIVNNLIRQNCVRTVDEGAGIQGHQAQAYIKDNTVADNYHCDERQGMPTWGVCSDGSSPTLNVYGIKGPTQSGSWFKMIHNIVYFNGPPGFDDMNVDMNTLFSMYSDVQMTGNWTPYPDWVTSPATGYENGTTNYDFDPLFEGKKDDHRPCNSTFYFLSVKSPCVDAGIRAYTDEWGQEHCEFVNTTTGSGKNVKYSVHISTLEDKDFWCKDGNNYAGTNYRIDLGYHYDWYGMNYIELSSFTVEAYSDKAVVRWATATEIDNAGFLVYRCDAEASGCSKVSGFIPATGAAASGAAYSFTDANVVSGATYYYYLVDVDTSGKWTAHGPVMTRIPVRFVPLPRLQLKAVEGLAAR